MFNSIFSDTLTVDSVILASITSIILGMVISYVHMKTSRYTKNFIITLAVLPILVAVVMMMVNGNLGTSVAIVGAFSLIRFRSMPGNAREIISIFWAMAIGLSLGMGQIYFASFVTVLVAMLLVVFYKTNYGEEKHKEKELKIFIPEDLDYDEVFDEIFKKYTDKYYMVSVQTIDMGSIFELKYRVVLKADIKEQDFLDDLRVRNGNLKIKLTHELDFETL